MPIYGFISIVESFTYQGSIVYRFKSHQGERIAF